MAGPWDHVERDRRDRQEGRLVPRRRVLGRRGKARRLRHLDDRDPLGALLNALGDQADEKRKGR